MEIRCPACRTRYRLDAAMAPRRVLRLRCAACDAHFRADLTDPARDAADRDRVGSELGWARRLARTLVSDIVVYHRARRDRALADGRLLDEFADELTEAWSVFRDQVDEERHGHVFRDAVNAVLAGGRPLL